MRQQPDRPNSYLFTVRVWRETTGEGQTEWRGQVLHVLTGERRYFRDWPMLVDYLLAMLRREEP